MSPTRHSKRDGLDWISVRERLAKAQANLASTLELSPERAKAIMDERARNLARTAAKNPVPGEMIEILAFGLGNEQYAVESKHVREVVRLVDFTPVPEAPDFLLGVMNLRGDIVAIAHLLRFFGVPADGLTDLSRVIVLGAGRAEIGILADETYELRTIPLAEAQKPPSSVAGIDGEYLIGITQSALIVLDGERLLTTPVFQPK